MTDDLTGEERHQKALAASLGMPDHPDAAAAERLRELAMQEQGAFAQIIKTWLREG